MILINCLWLASKLLTSLNWELFFCLQRKMHSFVITKNYKHIKDFNMQTQAGLHEIECETLYSLTLIGRQKG